MSPLILSCSPLGGQLVSLSSEALGFHLTRDCLGFLFFLAQAPPVPPTLSFTLSGCILR